MFLNVWGLKGESSRHVLQLDARTKNIKTLLEIPNLPPENGQPPCFMRIFFHVRDSTFRFAPPRKLNLSPFRASKIESWI